MKHSEWHVVIDDERGTLKLEFFRRMVFLHLALRKPLEGMRAAKAQFPAIKAILRNLGYRKVHVIIPNNDPKLYRFECLFGFTEVFRGAQNILMAQDC